MRVVLDTNVLLAALVSPHGPPDAIYRAWRSGRFELVTSTIQLEALRRASRYPKLKAILPAHRVGAMVNNLHRAVVLGKLSRLPEDMALADPDDEFLLAMALESQADHLVIGNTRSGLRALRNIGRTRIQTPAAFCEIIERG